MTLFGKLKYNCLPVGILTSLDIAQEIMEDIFQDFDMVDMYMDDIGISSNSYEDHMKHIQLFLATLH